MREDLWAELKAKAKTEGMSASGLLETYLEAALRGAEQPKTGDAPATASKPGEAPTIIASPEPRLEGGISAPTQSDAEEYRRKWSA